MAIYYEIDDEDAVKCVQVDVSRERGVWDLTNLLASGRLDEVRFVGETSAAIGIVRMLVRVGQFKRPAGESRKRLYQTGDERFPLRAPYVFVSPVPEPAAFD